MKKKECIVHIGMHKTGSSSIQASLYQQLKSEFFSYFDLNEPNHSERIFSLFVKERKNRIHSAYQKKGLTNNDIVDLNLNTKNMLINNMDVSNKSIMILSAEKITDLVTVELEELKFFFSLYFEKITIVAYVRTPKSYLESMFQQGVKSGVNKFMVEESYPDYRKRFEKFDNVFGRENVQLWKFDPKSFPDGNVVMDFCSRLGIQIQAENTVRVNESLSKEALSLLYVYRKYGSGLGASNNVLYGNRTLIKALKHIGKIKIKFSPTLIKPILEQNKDDLLWIEQRLGENLTESMDAGMDDIENEEDLLTVSEETLHELKDIIGFDYLPKEQKSNRIEEVVALVHVLYTKMAKNTKNYIQMDDEMKLIELAQKVQENNTEILGKMNEKKIVLIIREALKQSKQEIENTENDTIRIPMLGKFKIKIIEREEEGRKVTLKRIMFRLEKDKEMEES